MAVQIETQGQLQEFLGILKRRKWQVLLPASVVIALGIAVAVIVPKKYVAHTQIELRPVGVSISTKEGGNASFQIRGWNRITRVLRDRQNSEYLSLPIVEQADFIKRVQNDIKVTTGAGSAVGTSFVNIDYMDVNREWALDFLSALSKDWIDDVLDRDRRKAEDEEGKLLVEKGKLELQYKEETATISDIRTRNGLSATQPGSGSGSARNEDPVFERLTNAQKQLGQILVDSSTLHATLDKTQAQYDEMPARLPRENLVEGSSNDAALADIDKQIEDARAKLSNLKPSNSKYQKLSRDVEKLQARRDELRAQKTQASLEVTEVDNPDRKPLEQQIKELHVKIAANEATAKRLNEDIGTLTERSKELQDVYRDLDEHQGKAGRLSGALFEIEKKYNDQVQLVAILSSPEASPFQVVEDVGASTKPTEPNPWLIVSFGLVLGLGLGLAIALVAEFSKNCYRSVADISRVMVVPVLGSIGTILTRRERRITRVRRTIVGLSSVALVGAILFVTWAWARHAQLLSQDLRDAIEQLRSKMR